jgi:uncharacterized protein (DUF1810 family)
MDLERFVTAQDSGGTYRRAAAELRIGRKTSHWMRFIVSPQAKHLVTTLITSQQSAESPQ